MKRNIDVDQLRKNGYVVKSNFKQEKDTLSRVDGKPFKLWVGSRKHGKVVINGTTSVEMEKEYETGVHMRGNTFGGTIFGFDTIEFFAGDTRNIYIHKDGD